MSDPDKDKNNPEAKAEEIVDAVIVEDEEPTPDQPLDSDAEPTTSEEEPAEPVLTDEAEEEADEAPEVVEPETVEPEPQPEPVPEPVADTPKKGGFVPLVLGGIVAAGLGFGASKFVFPEGWPGAVDTAAVDQLTVTVGKQAAALDALQKRIDEVSAEPAADYSGEFGTLNDSLATLGDALRQVSGKLETLETRLTDLEKRPIAEGASSAAAEAYEREVKALKEAMDRQRAEIQDLMSTAEQEKASAELTAQQAMVRSAVSRIRVALDTGKGFAEALADLQTASVAVPAALSSVAENGVPTQAQLSASFPEDARRALSAARKAEGNAGSVLNFMRNQLGMRSLQPKEGADADAILSRAEAALADERLTDALAELQGLPEEARVELTGWMAKANQRVAALAAAEELSAQVAKN